MRSAASAVAKLGIGRSFRIHRVCEKHPNEVKVFSRLVVAFPASRVLTPDVAIGQPGQVARFEFSKDTKKGKHHHGRRADVVFVA